ncbi:MAG: acyl carrier protein [Bacillota bacterium]|nr:acyl carrier protein [Bacillota bacterium]
MDRIDIEKKVCEIVCQRSQFNKENIILDNDLRDNYGIDSIILVEMLIEMEEEFGVTFDSSMLSYEYFSTAKSISDYICSKACA